MKVLIDTNIILDLALTRANFYQEADKIFNLIEEGKIIGFVSATTLTDIYYILTKQKGKEFAFEFLKHLTTVCKINPITESIIIKALNNIYKDFEDNIQYYSALTNHLDAIVTRNVEDFPQNNLTILQPSELINIFKN